MLASPEQARIITALENDGVAHVALISRNNDTLAEELLAQQAQTILDIYYPKPPEETEDESGGNGETAGETGENPTEENSTGADGSSTDTDTEPDSAQR